MAGGGSLVLVDVAATLGADNQGKDEHQSHERWHAPEHDLELELNLFDLLPLVEEGAVSLSDMLHDVLNLIGRVLFSSLTSSSWRTVSL